MVRASSAISTPLRFCSNACSIPTSLRKTEEASSPTLNARQSSLNANSASITPLQVRAVACSMEPMEAALLRWLAGVSFWEMEPGMRGAQSRVVQLANRPPSWHVCSLIARLVSEVRSRVSLTPAPCFNCVRWKAIPHTRVLRYTAILDRIRFSPAARSGPTKAGTRTRA